MLIGAIGLYPRPGERAFTRITTLLEQSLGIAPVSQVDDSVLPADPGFIRSLAEAYEAVPWDRI